MQPAHIHATIITIGDELLIGQTTDTNSGWIAQQLNGIGIIVRRRIAIGDSIEAMQQVLDQEMPQAEILILTGGLGPTSDDITKPFLCDYFGGKLVVNEEVLAHVKGIFERRKRPFLQRNLDQAQVPDVCTVLPNAMGTAPGMWFEKEGRVVISLPGVPFEMIGIFEAEVMPQLRKQFPSGAIVHRTIVTAGEGESFVAEQIAAEETALPAHIKLAYLPHPGGVRLRLTGLGIDELQLIKEVEARRDELCAKLEKIVVAVEDLPLEHLLGKALLSKGKTIGLAESCTGGYIAHKMTQIMGSAQYLQGSVVCYQESVKEDLLGVNRRTIDKYCVVSEDVAKEMATGARKALKSDYGFGVTGLLSGGAVDQVAVGTVCMAVCDSEEMLVKTFHFQMDRLRNKDLAVQNALLLMLRFVQGSGRNKR